MKQLIPFITIKEWSILNALIEKRPEWNTRNGKMIFLHDNAPSLTHRKRDQRHHFYIWQATLVLSTVLTRLGTFALLLVLIDVSHNLQQSFQQLRRSRKLAWWLDHLKIRPPPFFFFWEDILNWLEWWVKYEASDGTYFE